MLAQSSPSSSSYLLFVLLTIGTWGLYGIFLHKGQVLMSPGDPNARYKAFLFVGIAYFLVAVLAPLAMLLITGSDWKMTGSGMSWSLIAGIVGAVGAFGVLLAFGAGGKPAVVMSLIFAGAPLVNAAVAITMDKQWGQVKPLFLVGIVLAAAGAYLIVTQKPKPVPHAKPTIQTQQDAASETK
ncbi:MAG: hypothetical protein AAGI37_16170 [Planctomycetota bacterium]